MMRGWESRRMKDGWVNRWVGKWIDDGWVGRCMHSDQPYLEHHIRRTILVIPLLRATGSTAQKAE